MARIDFINQYLRGEIILDIGCVGRSGIFHQEIRRLATGKVYGMDTDLSSLKTMRLPRLVCADARFLPFCDSIFDCIVLGELVEHLWDIRTALLDTRRVLKNDGMLVITTPNAYSFTRMLGYTLRNREQWGDTSHTTIFTPEALFRLLRKCGFEPTIFDTCRKLHIPFTSKTIALNIYGLHHLGEHICVMAKKI